MLRNDEPGTRRRPGRRGNDTLNATPSALRQLGDTIVACRQCDRLVPYRESVARERRRAFADWEYWGKPLPGFGDPGARLLIVGLAPAAHGGNRTGRVFTGDRSGDWLFSTLHRFGFANQPTSEHRDDGLQLRDAFVTAAVRCAPPDNKPTREEFATCGQFLRDERLLLPRVQIVIALGKLAFDAYLAARHADGETIPTPRPRFAHASVWLLGSETLLGSYHPSQRNTQTGFLTTAMFDTVFSRARELLHPG